MAPLLFRTGTSSETSLNLARSLLWEPPTRPRLFRLWTWVELSLLGSAYQKWGCGPVPTWNCSQPRIKICIEGSVANHLGHREDVVHYMQQHRQDFEPFVEDDISFDQHLRYVLPASRSCRLIFASIGQCCGTGTVGTGNFCLVNRNRNLSKCWNRNRNRK